MDINERHFTLLRLARLRQLKVRRPDADMWLVSSFTRENVWHRVTAGVCSCDANKYCTHLAIALDTHVKHEAGAHVYVEYMNAQREDFNGLRLRVLLDEQTAEDRKFTRPLIESVRAAQPLIEKRELSGCPF